MLKTIENIPTKTYLSLLISTGVAPELFCVLGQESSMLQAQTHLKVKHSSGGEDYKVCVVLLTPDRSSELKYFAKADEVATFGLEQVLSWLQSSFTVIVRCQ